MNRSVLRKWATMGFFLCIALSSIAYGQELDFNLSPRKIPLNEVVEFSITIEGDKSTNHRPTFQPKMELGDFELVNQSQQHHISSINGQQSSRLTYTYSLSPKKKGQLEFPQQVIKYNGKTYRTPAFTIEVTEEEKNLSANRSRGLFERPRTRPSGEVFATVETPKTSYYLGEPIPVAVYIYITPGLAPDRSSGMELPNFKDFWAEDVEVTTQQPERIRKDGKVYERYIVANKRLFANKVGELIIESARFELNIREKFASFMSQSVRANRTTQPITLTIEPLPKEGRPDKYTGLVGQFTLSAEMDKTEVPVGDTINLKVSLTGNGNFNAIGDLEIEGLGNAFEIFKGGVPTTEEKNGMVVSKSWAFALVPKREGDFTIPIPEVPFFDLKTKTYKVAKVDSYNLKVTPGEGLGSGAVIAGNNTGKTLVAEQNLIFIMMGELDDKGTEPTLASPTTLIKVGSLFLLVDILAFLGLFLREQLAGRREGMRPAFAMKNFKKALTRLKGEEKPDLFYGGLSEAILNYFGDKWEREGKGISLDAIQDRFERDGIESRYAQQVAELIEACDLARFTPSSSSSRENLMNKARSVIEEIEGVLK